MFLVSTDVQYEALSNLVQSINIFQKWTTNNKLKLNPSTIELMIACSTQNRPRIIVSQLNAVNGVVVQAKAI